MSSRTSNLTRFFRNAAHFKALEHVIVPEVVARKEHEGSRRIALWSVGCSTGEEPLSLAILLHETLPPGFEARIVAVDRDSRALDRAIRGCYQEAEVEGVPRRLRDRYFERREDGYCVCEELRRTIRFEHGSVESSEEAGSYDIVMCRNLLTYADAAGRRLIAARLWEGMAPCAHLFVGGSESLLGIDGRFEYLVNDWCVTFRKRADKPGLYDSWSGPLD